MRTTVCALASTPYNALTTWSRETDRSSKYDFDNLLCIVQTLIYSCLITTKTSLRMVCSGLTQTPRQALSSRCEPKLRINGEASLATYSPPESTFWPQRALNVSSFASTPPMRQHESCTSASASNRISNPLFSLVRVLSVRPNPSLEPTRYGRQRKPGPRHKVDSPSPGLRCLP